MRLIDADAFKEYICNAYEQVKHMYPDGGEWARQITEDFCKDIDDQPTAETEREWIPCSERLSKEKTDVLLAFKNNMVVGFWEDILNDGSVVWYANSGDGWLTQAEADYNDGIPLAWMPLPEPYKEGEQ